MDSVVGLVNPRAGHSRDFSVESIIRSYFWNCWYGNYWVRIGLKMMAPTEAEKLQFLKNRYLGIIRVAFLGCMSYFIVSNIEVGGYTKDWISWKINTRESTWSFQFRFSATHIFLFWKERYLSFFLWKVEFSVHFDLQFYCYRQHYVSISRSILIYRHFLFHCI